MRMVVFNTDSKIRYARRSPKPALKLDHKLMGMLKITDYAEGKLKKFHLKMFWQCHAMA